MKFYKTLGLVAVFALSVSFVGAEVATTTSSATSTNPVSKEKFQDRRAEIEKRINEIRDQSSSTRAQASSSRAEMRGENVKKACEAIGGRVDKRLSGFTEIHAEHEKVYETHIARLQAMSSKLQAKGIDVTGLNSDIAVLEVKIGKFKESKQAVVNALEAVKEFSCGDDTGEYRQALSVVKEAQKVLLEDARDTWGFIKTTIKGDLEDIRTQYKEKENI